MKLVIAIVLLSGYALYWSVDQLGTKIQTANYQQRAVMCAQLPDTKGCEEFGTAAGLQTESQPTEGTTP